jgi:ABC-2 type transport system ATP-binding protein
LASIKLNNASVDFPIPVRMRDMVHRTGKRLLGGSIDYSAHTIRALRDISVTVKEGDRIGIVGHNGAGKTTLLRVLAGIYEPTAGSARVDGRVSTLLNAAPGLDVNDTGLETIRASALHFGLNRAQINDRIDDIAAFTELGDYLEMPVRVYSSGMMTRLSFAIATSIDPEILIMDEGLATGDAAFAMKSQERITSLIKRSAIVILASHSVSMLKGMCTHGLALERGELVAEGEIGAVVEAYLQRTIAGAALGDQRHLDVAYSVAQDLVKRGESVPLAVEEQALRAALQRVPDDLTMILRLCQVLAEQDKEIPDAYRLRQLEHAIMLEPGNASVRSEIVVLRARMPDTVR